LVSSPDVTDPVISGLGLDLTPRELLDEIEITSPPETVLLQIAVTDANAERAARIADAVSLQLAKKIEGLETPRGKAVSRVKVTLTKPAAVPVIPTSPRPLLNLAFGALGGAALGLLVALLRHQLDRRIKSAEDIRAITGMSPLGSTLASRTARRDPLVAMDYRSLAAERYRTIRTGLKFATIDKDLHHFVVSSPMAGEGKTTVAANLAISWAQTGARVCLVDAGLRSPMVGHLLGIEGGVGLTEVVVGDAELDEALVSWNNGMLTVLPAGALPPDPAALLGSEPMHNLVSELRSRFDVVIYDSPSMASVADAVVLSRSVDGLVLVVRAGSTTRDQLAACTETLHESRLTLLGTVHFGVKSRRVASPPRSASDSGWQRTELPGPWADVSADVEPAEPVAKAPRTSKSARSRTAKVNQTAGVSEADQVVVNEVPGSK
jgi:non-specific protein-tyrosine kinase